MQYWGKLGAFLVAASGACSSGGAVLPDPGPRAHVARGSHRHVDRRGRWRARWSPVGSAPSGAGLYSIGIPKDKHSEITRPRSRRISSCSSPTQPGRGQQGAGDPPHHPRGGPGCARRCPSEGGDGQGGNAELDDVVPRRGSGQAVHFAARSSTERCLGITTSRKVPSGRRTPTADPWGGGQEHAPNAQAAETLAAGDTWPPTQCTAC